MIFRNQVEACMIRRPTQKELPTPTNIDHETLFTGELNGNYPAVETEVVSSTPFLYSQSLLNEAKAVIAYFNSIGEVFTSSDQLLCLD